MSHIIRPMSYVRGSCSGSTLFHFLLENLKCELNLRHHLIHFDIPWSLMVFQQRNGRIDRYGQEKTPYIFYLVSQSENKKINGDF